MLEALIPSVGSNSIVLNFRYFVRVFQRTLVKASVFLLEKGEHGLLDLKYDPGYIFPWRKKFTSPVQGRSFDFVYRSVLVVSGMLHV